MNKCMPNNRVFKIGLMSLFLTAEIKISRNLENGMISDLEEMLPSKLTAKLENWWQGRSLSLVGLLYWLSFLVRKISTSLKYKNDLEMKGSNGPHSWSL